MSCSGGFEGGDGVAKERSGKVGGPSPSVPIFHSHLFVAVYTGTL